jgi:dihydrofolate reductase
MIKVSLIVAVAENGVIGKNGGMAWRLPSETKYFKETTIGKPVVHGRKSFEALGKKPLPKRPNIIVTRKMDYAAENVDIAHSVPEAIEKAKAAALRTGVDEIFIAGGAEIYAEALEVADYLYITDIHGRPEGDTYFPPFDSRDWHEIKREVRHMRPAEEYDYTIRILERKKQ